MTNMKYPPVEHVRHINLTRADLSARIFIVGYLPVELKGNWWHITEESYGGPMNPSALILLL